MADQVFVAREHELAELNNFLERALAGHGQVCFVTGEAGAGKTALVTEFTRRAQLTHTDLVVAIGNCNAQTGIGDPYLPFREILGLLTGDVEAKLAQGVITEENADRLQGMLDLSGEMLMEYGPDLVDLFVPGAGLLMRAGKHIAAKVGWAAKLEEWLERRATRAVVGSDGLDQSRIFEQYTNVLQALSAQQPLALVLDDLHWADTSSISLLFHLGRRLGAGRMLIVGTYRPEDVALGRPATPRQAWDGTASGQMRQHPLDDVANEFKRYYGDIWVELGQAATAEGRQFVDSLLDAEPNQLGETFRQALFRHTGGQPLFTVELLRDMRERGDLFQDVAGRWVAAPTVAWDALPARVEGVIETRIDRLEEELWEVLAVASVEGEDFTAEVVARVQERRERELLRELSRELEKRHRLVRERGEITVGPQRLSQYRFAHTLVQQYVYDEVSSGERRLLHGEVAEALEALYGDRADEIAVQLAHHFTHGEDWEKAFLYLTRAGDKARQVYANHEAIAFYTQALEVGRRVTPPLGEAQLLPVYEGRGLIWMLQSSYDEAIADFHTMRQLAKDSGNTRKEGESLSHLAGAHFFKLSENEIPFIEQYAQEARHLAEQTGDQRTVARSLISLALVDQARGDLMEGERKFAESLQISRREGYKDSLAENLTWLSVHAHWQGDFQRAVPLCQESLVVCSEIHDGFGELTNLSFLCLEQGSLGNYREAFNTIHDGLAKARERESKFIVGRLTNSLAWLHSELGDFSRALDYDHESAELGRTYGIPNVEISALINLGLDYFALGQHDQALSYLEPTLERVEDEAFGSHRWRWKVRLLNGLAMLYHGMEDYEEALRFAEAGLSEALATSSKKYIARDQALRGKILAHLGNTEAAGAQLQQALTLAESLNSPSICYPIAYDLGQWYQATGQERNAAESYGKAKAAIEQMVAAVDDEALRSTFLQSRLVQAAHEGFATAR